MSRTIGTLLALAAAAAATWLPIGPEGGLVQALAVDPARPDTLYCMGYNPVGPQPVYRTVDRAAHWERVGAIPSWGIGLVVDRFDPAIVYCPTGADQIQRSTDAGASWDVFNLPFYASAFAGDPFVRGRVYAAGTIYDTIASPVFGISTDFGQTWSAAAVVNDTGSIYSLDASPVDSGTIFLGGDYGAAYRSTDAGASWQAYTSGFAYDDVILCLSASHGDPAVVCAGTIYGMFRSTDAGQSWRQVGTPRFVMAVDLSPADPAKGYASGYDTAAVCYYTTDAGVTWLPTAPVNPTGRSSSIIADPGLGDGAWCPTQSGVARTTDRGATWSLVNTGIRTAVVSTISVPAWGRGRVYIEVQGIGVYSSPDGGQTWQRCADFLSCGNICGIGLAPGGGHDVLYALEGAG